MISAEDSATPVLMRWKESHTRLSLAFGGCRVGLEVRPVTLREDSDEGALGFVTLSGDFMLTCKFRPSEAKLRQTSKGISVSILLPDGGFLNVSEF